MDGYITIGTELLTDKFDRQVANLENKIKSEEDKQINIEAQISNLEKTKNDYKELQKEVETYRIKLEELQNLPQRAKELGKNLPAAPYLEALSQAKMQYEESNNKLIEQKFNLEKINSELSKLQTKHTEINENISKYNQKIQAINIQRQLSDVERMKQGFVGIGNSIQNAVKKATRLALGIFSIRSAYLGVRQAVSLLSQYNEGLANQIQAIKMALAVTIEPIVNFIVNTVGKVVSFLGYILKQLFGIDIFARATALSFNKISKGASGTTKAVKELKKQLTGFDEINMLNKDGTTGIGNSLDAGGIGSDVSDISNSLQDLNAQGEEVFKNFKKWFLGSDKDTFAGIWEDNIKTISNFIEDMKIAFKPLGNWINTNVWVPIRTFFQQTWNELAPIINPIKKAFQKTIEEIKPLWIGLKDNFLKPLWDGFLEYVAKPIKKTFEPIGIQIYNALVPYINVLIDFFNKTFGVFGLNIKKLETKTVDSMGEVGKEAKGELNSVNKTAQNNTSGIIKIISGAITNIKKVFGGVGKFFNTTFSDASKKTKGAFNGIGKFFENVWKSIKNAFKSVSKFFKTTFNGAWKNMKNPFSGVGKFFDDVWKTIKKKFKNIGQKAGDAVGSSFKEAINSAIRTVEKVLNYAIKAINSLLGAINKVPRNKFAKIK